MHLARTLLFVLILGWGTQSLAHTHHDHDHGHHGLHQFETEIDADKLTSDQLAEKLIHDIHEISHEHGRKPEVQSFVRRWVNNFNLVRSGRDLLRWTHHKTQVQPALREHIGNLALLFGASHVLETLSGPVGALIGNEIGLPTAVNGAILAVGGLISIPGLDPVCIMLAATYKVSPSFRVHTTKLRMAVQKSSKSLAQHLGLPRFVSLFGKWQPGKDRMMSLLGKDQMSFELSGGSLVFDRDEDRMWLKQVHINEPEQFWPEWEKVRNRFDYNTKKAVDQLRKSASQLPFFASTSSKANHYELLTGAVRPWGRWLWRGCDDLLEKAD